MSATLTFDDSLWPLVIFRFTGVMSGPQYERFFVRANAYLERGEKYVCITDVSQAGIPTPAQCRQLADWLRANDAALREQVLGNAILVTTAPLRLSMSLVFHLKPPPMPHVAVADMDSAVDFVLGKLRGAGFVDQAEHIRHHLTCRAGTSSAASGASSH